MLGEAGEHRVGRAGTPAQTAGQRGPRKRTLPVTAGTAVRAPQKFYSLGRETGDTAFTRWPRSGTKPLSFKAGAR